MPVGAPLDCSSLVTGGKDQDCGEAALSSDSLRFAMYQESFFLPSFFVVTKPCGKCSWSDAYLLCVFVIDFVRPKE